MDYLRYFQIFEAKFDILPRSDVENLHFVGQKRLWEHFLGLIQQHVLIFVTGTVMTQQQAPYPCIAGYGSGLTGCGVEILLRLRQMVVAIGALMIEGVDPEQLFVEVRHISRVADVGITTGRICGDHESAVGDDLAIR